ncbi:MAG: 2-polyprenyl-3-methyl-6-methoxy-1,4-benzoquinone monooxygenase [Pseudomonadota bacterium]|nr:2-polyprenyl-3-methyl-6-methoxy-1,4-benzoquinone monooxygenase [Pseudomonadota bacterium]
MNLTDHFIQQFDRALRTLFAPAQARRESPARADMETPALQHEKAAAARLMRINHTGEVCAQALYQGQALTARHAEIRATLGRAADEEQDHLAWCEDRIDELGGRKSLLNPLWYGGSFALGALSGLLGDRWNMAFLAETERQVEGHLAGHLDQLPASDAKSRAVLEQMRRDEAEHGMTAQAHGAAQMPGPLKVVMLLGSKVMKTATYWI